MWKELAHYAFDSADWEIDTDTNWAVGLQLDLTRPLNESLTFHQGQVGTLPFSPDSYPTSVTVKGRAIEGWVEVTNAAGAPPQSPVTSTAPLMDLLLIPYGATDLRISEFPTLA